MNIGCEYNIGKKEERYEGTIFTDNGTVSELNAAKWAQRISFGSFFYFKLCVNSYFVYLITFH